MELQLRLPPTGLRQEKYSKVCVFLERSSMPPYHHTYLLYVYVNLSGQSVVYLRTYVYVK